MGEPPDGAGPRGNGHAPVEETPMSVGPSRQPTTGVVVLAAGREATLDRCLEGLAQQDVPTEFVVVVVDSAPSAGAADYALHHPAVHRVVLVNEPDHVALCRRGIYAGRFDRMALIDAAFCPDDRWLASGLALIEGGVDVAVGHETNGDLAELFIAAHVPDRIQVVADEDTDGARLDEFFRRCQAAGMNTVSGAARLLRRPPLAAIRELLPGSRRPSPGLAPPSYRDRPNVDQTAGEGLISVVVCSGGKRPEQLERCLDSISCLEDPNFEILLIDNSPSPAVRLDQLPAGVKHVHEPRRGLDRARNRGIHEASGDMVAFVDDDCEVHPAWLTGIRAGFADPLVSFVTGRVRPARLDRESQQWFETHFSFDRGPCSRRFTRYDHGGRSPLLLGELGTGANMAFRRTLLDRIGGFDVNLDMGTLVGGGGDLDIFARALEEGEVAHYAADAVVFHHHRDSFTKLRWQIWGYGISQGALCAKYAVEGRGGRLHSIMRFLRTLRDRQRQIAAIRRGQDRYPLDLARLELLGVALGPLAYVASMVQQRRTGRG